jgi:hypothetical protein
LVPKTFLAAVIISGRNPDERGDTAQKLVDAECIADSTGNIRESDGESDYGKGKRHESFMLNLMFHAEHAKSFL